MKFTVVLALVAITCVCAQNLTPITAPNFPNFPFGTDGSVIWATTIQSIRAPSTNGAGQTLRFGADYFDYVCMSSGPQQRGTFSLVASPNTDQWYSRAIVCSTGQQTDSAANGRRTASQYFNYGLATQTSAGKPVYTFDPESRPTQFVRVATNPAALFSQGINRQLSAGTNTVGGFRQFYGTDGVVLGQTTGASPSRSLATFPAWTGCTTVGQPNTGFTCQDWSTTSATVSGEVGNTGAPPRQYTSATFETRWLDLIGETVATQTCNTPSLFLYCSWIPTADDGWQNGDETSIDCGGSTLLITGLPRGQCGPCPAGTSGPVNGPCVSCAAGRYSYTGGAAACLPCAINANSAAGASVCTCNVGYSLPANYDVTTQARDGSLCLALIRGDPQITGLQGQDFQVHGIPDEYFNMVSTPEMQVNSRFVFLNDARCMDNSTTCFTHPGTYIDVMAFTIGAHKVKVLAGTYEQGLRAFIGETEIFVGEKQTLSNPTVQVSFLAKNRVLVQNGLFRFVLVNSDNFMNQEVALLDAKLLKLGAAVVKVAAGETAPHAEIPIHGILGQTWQNLVFPAGMFIEGEVADYRVADGAFGTDFVYNKFNA